MTALPPANRPAFEEGAMLIFRRWTALQLAVDQGWGGPDSGGRADALLRDTINWFYSNKEHYADDLEVDLDEIMAADFNMELEDDSPREVSKALVSLWQGCCSGDLTQLQHLRTAVNPMRPSAAAASKPQGEDGSSGDSSDDDGEDGEAMDEDAPQQQPKPPRRPPPEVDEDGFQTVQRRTRR